jgi:hypothetical protein
MKRNKKSYAHSSAEFNKTVRINLIVNVTFNYYYY